MISEEIEQIVGPALAKEEGLPENWSAHLASYLDLVQAGNRKVNLVSRSTADQMVGAQLLPSLAALRVVPAGVRIRVLDVGTGGGFPGIPLKILRPEIRLDLVDATAKKCAFLKGAVADLGLEEVRVHWCRIEAPEEALRERGPFDVLLARAVGALALLEKAAAPLLAPGGSAWRWVAPEEGEEDLPWPLEPAQPVTALRRFT